MIYPLVKEMAAVGAPVRVPVAVACRVLGFSKQGYYKWLKQPVSAREAEERELIAVLHQLHDDDPEGGYRVLAHDITELGYTLSERRVWRLCRVAGIQSTIVKRKSRYKSAGEPVHDDLVNRQFTADGPNELWLTDITEHRTREGKVYLCAIMPHPAHDERRPALAHYVSPSPRWPQRSSHQGVCGRRVHAVHSPTRHGGAQTPPARCCAAPRRGHLEHSLPCG